MTQPQPLALALGGGGPFGIAYDFGVVDALRAAGMPVCTAAVLGTSAGAWVGAAVRAGLSFPDLAGCVRGRGRGWDRLPALARDLFGDASCPGLLVSAVRVPAMRPVVLDAGAMPVWQALVASSSVPGLFPAARVGEQRYVDGGCWSNTSADQAPPAQQLVVASPMSGPVVPPAGWLLEQRTRAEMRRWSAAHRAPAALLRPAAGLAARTWGPRSLFRDDNLDQVYAAALRQTASWVDDQRT